MRKNTRKLKPNSNNIRSSSIRDIIGDRRFHEQFNRVNNTHGNEGIKKLKRTKVGGTDADDVRNSGQNASSSQCEATENPRRDYGDFAAKTSEYAFFKKLKQNTDSEVHVRPNNHDNQSKNVQQSHHFTREEFPNVQKENIKQNHNYIRKETPNVRKESIKHVDKEQNEAQYSLFSTPCIPKTSEANDEYGADITNVQNVKLGAYNWLSPSMSSKSKNTENKGIFSMKREKLRNMVENNKSLYDVDEVSSNGFNLVSALISRLLPPDQKTNSRRDPVSFKDKTDSKYKGNEDYKRKLIESPSTSYLDDGFSRSTKRFIDTDLLEWDPTGHAPKCSIQYNRCHTEAYKESLIEYPRISYLDDDIYSSTERHIDMYNPTCLEESFLGGRSRTCSIRDNHGLTEYGFRNPNFDVDSILSFDESRNLHELETSHFHNGPKLLDPPQTLLLGWEDNTENDKFQLSAFDSQTEINPFSPSSTSHSFSPPSSPYMNRHLKQEHLLASSIIPYTPNHLTTVEDRNTWCMDETFNEKEHHGSESFLFLIQSPGNNILRFLDTGLNSFAVNDENEEDFVHRTHGFSGDRMKGYSSSSYMDSYDERHFDHIEYPLLLHDSSWNE